MLRYNHTRAPYSALIYREVVVSSLRVLDGAMNVLKTSSVMVQKTANDAITDDNSAMGHMWRLDEIISDLLFKVWYLKGNVNEIHESIWPGVEVPGTKPGINSKKKTGER